MLTVKKGTKIVMLDPVFYPDDYGLVTEVIDIVERDVEYTTFNGVSWVKTQFYVIEDGREIMPYSVQPIGTFKFNLSRLCLKIEMLPNDRKGKVQFIDTKTGKEYTYEDHILYLGGEKVLLDSWEALQYVLYGAHYEVEVKYHERNI